MSHPDLKIGCWVAHCCVVDLHQITTQEELDHAIAMEAEVGFAVIEPTEELALRMLGEEEPS